MINNHGQRDAKQRYEDGMVMRESLNYIIQE